MDRGSVYDVRTYGAVGDGTTKDTEAVQSAIDACAEAGGGTVAVAGGIFVVGTIFLRSGVTVEIQSSAKVLASPCIDDYAAEVHHNRYRNEPDMDRCLFFGEDASQIAIRGGGIIDGNAEAFPNKGSIYRPMMFRFLRCTQIHLEGLRLYDAAAWTTAFLDSSYIWVDGVDIRNEKRYNGDGLDFDGCSHVYVSNCNIRGTDDNLCLQAGSKAFPMEDVHIQNCSFSSICAGIRIGLKSIGTIRDVVISNCTMKNVWREGIKIECTEGGTMERIRFCGIHAVDEEEMKQVHKRFDQDVMGSPAFAGIRVDAEQGHKIRFLTFCGLHYRFIGGVRKAEIPEHYPEVTDRRLCQSGEVSENYYPDWSRAAFLDLRHVDGLVLEDVVLEAVEPDERKPVIIEGCQVMKKEIYQMR